MTTQLETDLTSAFTPATMPTTIGGATAVWKNILVTDTLGTLPSDVSTLQSTVATLKSRVDAMDANLIPWILVGSGGSAPAFTGLWVNYTTGYYLPAAFRKVNNCVMLRGNVKSGAIGTPIFTLPVGYRPALPVSCPVAILTATTASYVLINADGTVNPTHGSDSSTFSLDGVMFYVD